jgi:hypothetical protein
MKRFKSARQAQWFVSVHDQVANLFQIPYPESTTAAAAAIRATAALLSGSKSSTQLPWPDVRLDQNLSPLARGFVTLTAPLEVIDFGFS